MAAMIIAAIFLVISTIGEIFSIGEISPSTSPVDRNDSTIGSFSHYLIMLNLIELTLPMTDLCI